MSSDVAPISENTDSNNVKISALDSGYAAIQLGKLTDGHHVNNLKKISTELEDVNTILRKFSALKRQIEAKNDGKSDTYDITELHEKLLDFQEHFNQSVSEGEKLNFDTKEAYEALQSKSGKELEAISRKVEDAVGDLKDKASDASNQVYLQGHLYTIVMNIFQELIRTDCRGKERLAQASRGH